ncbi:MULTISPECIES: (2Fe-2S)-binding protein [Oceanobacillus]|uniref:(2Fe-2S)-binding protein n=1 Tax=Oceanobacillus TaxID=182709 RepID=UPI0021171D8D|nr:(2Fe-2S)-binding protein [Oceanobacillus oncorhynchi]UUI41780.1 (2Fe-2S)-binding protein [Oceanobacillus oncorhynchi]
MADEDIIICRCEEITLKEINQTIDHYHCSSREVKLRTRAGMGYCGGRTCRSMIDQIVQSHDSAPRTDGISLSYRPPVRPVSFGTLGGMDHVSED